MCICRKTKIRKSNDEEGGDKQKKAMLITENEKQQESFQFMSVRL